MKHEQVTSAGDLAGLSVRLNLVGIVFDDYHMDGASRDIVKHTISICTRSRICE